MVLLRELDTDGSGMLSQEELNKVITNPDALRTLRALDVDIEHILQIEDMLFEEAGNDIAISAIMELFLNQRSRHGVSRRDIKDELAYTRWKLQTQLEEHELRAQQLWKNLERLVIMRTEDISSRETKTQKQSNLPVVWENGDKCNGFSAGVVSDEVSQL